MAPKGTTKNATPYQMDALTLAVLADAAYTAGLKKKPAAAEVVAKAAVNPASHASAIGVTTYKQLRYFLLRKWRGKIRRGRQSRIAHKSRLLREIRKKWVKLPPREKDSLIKEWQMSQRGVITHENTKPGRRFLGKQHPRSSHEAVGTVPNQICIPTESPSVVAHGVTVPSQVGIASGSSTADEHGGVVPNQVCLPRSSSLAMP